MITSIRNKFNAQFTEAKYKNYLAELELPYPGCLEFRIAETPVFVPKEFKHKLLEVSEYISSVILSKDFKKITEQATPAEYNVPMETPFPACVVMDFAVSKNASDELEPQLIELQGFPSLFAFEILQDQTIRNNYTIPDGFTCYLNGYDEFKYINHLKTLIEGTNNKHTVLLELYPHQQKTRIDFYCTQQYTEIPVVCISEIYAREHKLYYKREGTEFLIERIYNRLVWDELKTQPAEIQLKRDLLLKDLEVEWVNHPNHFYRISKYLLPFLFHKYVPKATLLSSLNELPEHLEDYVLKPLYSFAGQGVLIDVTKEDISSITNKENWILQKKVTYSPIVTTPTGPAKAEIRLFCFYNPIEKKYIATNNLTRLSKGKMIGVDYNKTATWVGGSLAYFEND
jgi:hypothetical protein